MDKTIYFYINHLYYLFNQREIPNIIKAQKLSKDHSRKIIVKTHNTDILELFFSKGTTGI